MEKQTERQLLTFSAGSLIFIQTWEKYSMLPQIHDITAIFYMHLPIQAIEQSHKTLFAALQLHDYYTPNRRLLCKWVEAYCSDRLQHCRRHRLRQIKLMTKLWTSFSLQPTTPVTTITKEQHSEQEIQNTHNTSTTVCELPATLRKRYHLEAWTSKYLQAIL